MTNNLKDFLKKVNSDEELAKKFEALQGEEERKTVIQQAIELAKEMGITLAEADFAESENEMSDEEMLAVAGGWKECYCVAGGGGKADEDGKACACVVAGMGTNQKDHWLRCSCCVGGYGYDD